MLDDDIVEAARQLLDICKRKKLLVATAESCTAGLVAGTLTEVPGVSSMLDRGFITYSNEAKQEMLGVAKATLDKFGAVSKETAIEMAKGALARAPVDLTISVTGIAGPDGGSEEKPVGLVHFAGASRDGQLVHSEQRFGAPGRDEVRKRSVLHAFRMLHDLAEKETPGPKAKK
jgi:nicotinamide-nucleotide amidase